MINFFFPIRSLQIWRSQINLSFDEVLTHRKLSRRSEVNLLFVLKDLPSFLTPLKPQNYAFRDIS